MKTVLSFGMGVESSALLLRWLEEPESRNFDLERDLIVIRKRCGEQRIAPASNVPVHLAAEKGIVMATERTEFGFKRIVCACAACTRFCFTLPGNLVPGDLQRMADYLKESDIVRFALDNLLASPGAIVAVNGICFSIPTLVPARRPDGACRFLKHGRCTIHAEAPYGCSFFSVEQARDEADARSARGLMEIAKAWQRRDLYARLWLMLHEAGRIAPSPLEARARMQAAMDDTPDDLSECELQEIEDEAIRQLREEGLLRPRRVNPTERDPQTDSSDANLPNWPGAF